MDVGAAKCTRFAVFGRFGETKLGNSTSGSGGVADLGGGSSMGGAVLSGQSKHGVALAVRRVEWQRRSRRADQMGEGGIQGQSKGRGVELVE